MAIRKSRGVVETEVKVTGEDKYARDLKRTEESLDRVRDGARDLDSVFRDLGGGSAIAAAAIGAIIAEIEVATRVWGAFIDVGERAIEVYGRLGERGGAVAAVAGYFEQIADPGLLQRLQRLSGWHVSQQAIMESFNTTIRTGIVAQEQFVEFFEATVAAAQTAGEDIEDVWEGVSEALGVGGLDVFERLGVNIFDVEEKLDRMGLTAETVEGRAAALKIILQELQTITGGASNAASNLSDAWEAAAVRGGDFYDQIARIVSTSPATVAFFDTFQQKLFGIEGQSIKTGKAIADIALITVQAMAVGIEWTARFIGGMSEIALQIAALFPDPQDVPSFMRRSLMRVDELRGMHQGIVQTTSELADAADAARRASLSAAAIAGSTAGAVPGIGGRLDPRRPVRERQEAAEVEFELIDFAQMRIEALGRIDELSQARVESDQLLLSITETQIGLEQELGDAERERQDAWLQRVQAIGEAHEKAIQWEQRNAEAAVEAARARQAALMENLSTASQTVSTIGGIFDMISQSQERSARATEIAYRIEGGLLGVKNTILAIEAGAEAVGQFASLNIIGGLAYTAKAAQHTSAAVMAFTQLAKGSGAGAGAGAAAAATSPGTFIPARTDTMAGPQRPAGGGNTYNIFTMGGSDLARQVGRAEYQLQRSGQFAQAPSSGIRFTG